MKRNLILTLLACGSSVMLSTAAQAQITPALVSSSTATPVAAPTCTPGGYHHKGGLLEHLTHALSLTDAQQAQIAPLLEQARPQLKTIHDNAVAQRKTVLDSVSAQITPLLTADQQTKFAQMVTNVESGPASGGPGGHHWKHQGPGAGGPDVQLQKMTAALSLTTDQQTQIKPILVAAHTQIEAIRQNTSLTQDQKFAQIKVTMQAAHSQINGILTPPQQAQMEAMKAQFHHGNAQPAASPVTTGS